MFVPVGLSVGQVWYDDVKWFTFAFCKKEIKLIIVETVCHKLQEGSAYLDTVSHCE